MWGANSRAAAAAKGYNSLAEVIAAMNGSGSNNSSNSSSDSGNSGSSGYTTVKATYANGKVVTYSAKSDWQSLVAYWEKQYGKATITKYATGGLADFTGPAWLDGTKSRPELVLN
jgi:hypothetical protein